MALFLLKGKAGTRCTGPHTLPTERTVGTPDGEATATTIVMDDAGLYNAGTVYSANLLDATESDVSATSSSKTDTGRSGR